MFRLTQERPGAKIGTLPIRNHFVSCVSFFILSAASLITAGRVGKIFGGWMRIREKFSSEPATRFKPGRLRWRGPIVANFEILNKNRSLDGTENVSVQIRNATDANLLRNRGAQTTNSNPPRWIRNGHITGDRIEPGEIRICQTSGQLLEKIPPTHRPARHRTTAGGDKPKGSEHKLGLRVRPWGTLNATPPGTNFFWKGTPQPIFFYGPMRFQ